MTVFKRSVRKKHKGRKSESAVTSRMSLRQREMAYVPIPKRAELLTLKKNLEHSGNTSNPFAVFQLLDNTELNNIAVASNIVLGSSPEEIENNLESLKAKEIAQARLAQLRWKKELEKNKNQQQMTAEIVNTSESTDLELYIKGGAVKEVINKTVSADQASTLEVNSERDIEETSIEERGIERDCYPEPKKRGGPKKQKKK